MRMENQISNSWYVCHLQALNKKEHKNGTCSPDSPEPDSEYQLTPRTEAKYSKIDEEFQMMMQRNQQINGSRVSTNFSTFYIHHETLLFLSND